MALQLIYTSAPRLLQAGRTGFGTVAAHAAIRPALREELERISQFSRVDGIDIRRVIYYHRIIQAGGETVSVISRIRDCGLDYTGRSNHIAHHLVLAAHELPRLRHLTPCDLILAMASLHLWRGEWTEDAHTFEARDEIDVAGFSNSVTLPAQTWNSVTGQAAHAALLAPSPFAESCWIVWPESDSTQRLRLLGEAALLHSNAWQITFSTDVQPTDRVEELAWRGLDRSSPVTATAAKSVRPTLDLTDPSSLPHPTPEFAHLAETGHRMAAFKAHPGSSTHGQGPLLSAKPTRGSQPAGTESAAETTGMPPSLLERKKRAQLSNTVPEPVSRGKQLAILIPSALVAVAIMLAGAVWIKEARDKSGLRAEIIKGVESWSFEGEQQLTEAHLVGLSKETLGEIKDLIARLTPKPTEAGWPEIASHIKNAQTKWENEGRLPEKFNQWLTGYHDQQASAVGLQSQKNTLAAAISAGNLDDALEALTRAANQSEIASSEQINLLNAWGEFSESPASEADIAIMKMIAAVPPHSTPELHAFLDAGFVRKQQAEFAGLDTDSAQGFWKDGNPNPAQLRNQSAKEDDALFPQWAALLTAPELGAESIEAVQAAVTAEDSENRGTTKDEFLVPFETMGLDTASYAGWFDKKAAEKVDFARSQKEQRGIATAEPLIEWVDKLKFVSRVQSSNGQFAIIEGGDDNTVREKILRREIKPPSTLRSMMQVDVPIIENAAAILLSAPNERRRFLLSPPNAPITLSTTDSELRPKYDPNTKTISFPEALLLRLQATKNDAPATIRWEISGLGGGALELSSQSPPAISLEEAASSMDSEIAELTEKQTAEQTAAITVETVRKNAKVLAEAKMLTALQGEGRDLSDWDLQILDAAIDNEPPPRALFSDVLARLQQKAKNLREEKNSVGKKDRDDRAGSIDRLYGNINTFKPDSEEGDVKISQYLRDAARHLQEPAPTDEIMTAVNFMLFEYPRFQNQADVAKAQGQELQKLKARRAILDKPSGPVNELKLIVSYGGQPLLTLTF